jgi:DnaJ homolog subfamily C member 9
MARKPRSKPQPEEEPELDQDEEVEDEGEDLTSSEPPEIDPYKVLRLQKTATSDDVKSAYRKLALKHHPDKAKQEDREAANKTFQDIAFAYAVLSDERRRKGYDATGNTAESANLEDDDFNWVDFFREQKQNVVTADMIEQVKKEYQGSEEEKDDVLAAYEQGEGDMDAVFESVMCSEVITDDDRFRNIIDAAIAAGEVESYPQYTKETKKSREKRKAKARSEAEEAKELARELGVEDKLFGKKNGSKKPKKGEDDIGGLQQLIQQRQQSRAQNFFDDLEAKYGGGKKRKNADEPPEEAFQKNAKKGKKGVK